MNALTPEVINLLNAAQNLLAARDDQMNTRVEWAALEGAVWACERAKRIPPEHEPEPKPPSAD